MKKSGFLVIASLVAGVAVFALSTADGGGPEVAVAQQNQDAAALVPATTVADALPDARPGECYAKVFVPAEYKKVTEEIVTREASEKIEIIPAKWEWVEEKVMVKPAAKKLVPVAAVFEKAEERVEIAPAHVVWRTGNSTKSAVAKPALTAAALALGVPANAKPGECYAEYLIPAEYKTEMVKVQVRDAAEKIAVVPAKFEPAEEKVVVKEATVNLIDEPAVFETTSEEVLIKPGYKTWKTGTRPIERIENAAGDIMCFVEVPPEYMTVQKKVLKSPGKLNKVDVPAEYKTVPTQKLVAAAQATREKLPAEFKEVEKKVLVSDAKVVWRLQGTPGPGKATGRTLCLAEVPAKYTTVVKQVLKTPATTKEVEIPAEYKTVRVKKIVSPAQEKRVTVPAKTELVTKRVKVSDGRLEWRPILCEVNIQEDVVYDIQRALKEAGYNPGPIDGVIGQQTLVALNEFQRSKGLATGGLTLDTIRALGIKIGG